MNSVLYMLSSDCSRFLQISLSADTHKDILLVTATLLCSVHSDTTDQMVRNQNLQNNYLHIIILILFAVSFPCNTSSKI